MSPESALAGWALVLAYALPVGLILALLAQLLRSRAVTGRKHVAEEELRSIEATLAQMKAEPDADADRAPVESNGATRAD